MTDNAAHVAVGTAALSSEDMYMAGRRGKGVNILHFYGGLGTFNIQSRFFKTLECINFIVGDELWASGSRQELPKLAPPAGLEFLDKTEKEEEEDDDEDDEEDEENEEENGGEGNEEAEKADQNEGEAEKLSERLESDLKVEEKEEVADTRTPQEIMDELLLHAFLQAWKVSAKKIEFPILSSNFFRVHMVKQSAQPLDVKKSSHKKLSKFLAKMQSDGLIQVKELQKGVESIVSVNLQHEKIQLHRVVKVQAEEVEKEEVLPCDRPYEAPVISELFLVSGATVEFFKKLKLKKGDALTAADVKEKLREYVKENDLQDQGPGTRGQVNLDPVLAGLVLGKGENGVTCMTWEELGSRIQSKMSQGYSMRFPGMSNSMVVVKKGKLDPIELTVGTRSGNKKVTLVHNLELFGIDPSEFAHRCQTGVAASTSVGEAPNRRPGAMEVLVQGNQVMFASKLLLESYKIPRKYVKGIEEAKKKGKKK